MEIKTFPIKDQFYIKIKGEEQLNYGKEEVLTKKKRKKRRIKVQIANGKMCTV